MGKTIVRNICSGRARIGRPVGPVFVSQRQPSRLLPQEGHLAGRFNFVQAQFLAAYTKFKIDCQTVQRLGDDGDGGKFICTSIIQPNKCILYSIGSRKDFSFEIDVVKKLGCTVHTFDCTVGEVKPEEVPTGVTFHPWCIGANNGNSVFHSDLSNKTENEIGRYVSIQTAMTLLNHSHVDVLKMDIERHEFKVIDSLKCPNCIGQLAIEIHLHNAYNMWKRPVSQREWNTLWTQLTDRDGFGVFSYEPNPKSSCCCEYSLLNRHIYPPARNSTIKH